MGTDIASLLQRCREKGIYQPILAMPFGMDADDIAAALGTSLCSGLVLPRDDANSTAFDHAGRIGTFDGNDRWRLPSCSGQLVFVGPPGLLSPAMVVQLIASGRTCLICSYARQWSRLGMGSLLQHAARETLRDIVRRHTSGGRGRRFVKWLVTQRKLHAAWRRAAAPKTLSARRPCTPAGDAVCPGEPFRELIGHSKVARGDARTSTYSQRLLLVNANLGAGGAERQLVNTAVAMQATGRWEQVRVLTAQTGVGSDEEFYQSELEEHGIQGMHLRRDGFTLRSSLTALGLDRCAVMERIPFHAREAIARATSVVRDFRPTVLHAWQDGSNVTAGMAAVLEGVPRVVLGCRSMAPDRFPHYEPWMLPAYQAIAGHPSVSLTANSNAAAGDYERWIGLPRGTVAVIRNGIAPTMFARPPKKQVFDFRLEHGIPAPAVVVGGMLRFVPVKRPLLWIDTAIEVLRRDSRAHCLLIGEGPLRRDVYRRIRAARVSNRVTVLPNQPMARLAISAMDVMLLTSEYEGCPNVILEAQALGVPVVATGAGGVAEAFQPGQSGLFCDLSDPAAIAERLQSLLEDGTSRAAMGDAGRAFVAAAFALSRAIDELLDLYSPVGPGAGSGRA